MKNIKRLTLLHSNDMHGDFLAEEVDQTLVGGVSMLSGYINKVRSEEKNVLYAISGDMLQGSVIDSEFKGISTIQIMNTLAPDIVTLGNHEVDYGLAHLLFLEKCAEFPIINANMYITTNHKRLFSPYKIIEIDGMKILFIGIITEITLMECRKDNLIGTFITLEDAAEEVGRICNTYNSLDVDLTVLLTHIGIEEDKRLAKLIDNAWGVDLIIGGHSHTFLEKPVVVNGIPIVQAGIGTDQIGRFDLNIDVDNNCIESYSWKPVPINSENCPRDPAIERVIDIYQSQTDAKYGQILTRFVRELSHPSRIQETELGNLFADILKDALGVDIFLMASGSVRVEHMGPLVTKGDFTTCFPFDDSAHVLYWTGAMLKHAIKHMLRDDTLDGAHNEFYQLSHGLEVEYDRNSHSFIKFNFEGEPLADDRIITVGLQHYHFLNVKDSFDLNPEEVQSIKKERIAASSCCQIIEEALAEGQHQNSKIEGRIVIHQ